MQKGEQIKFLDYTIKNSLNNDGIVLFKEGVSNYECHLGNYSTLDHAQKAAIIFFMLNRPETFATTMYYRAMGRGGQYHEFGCLKTALKKANLEMPEEVTPGNGINFQIHYKGQPLSF